MLWGVTVCLWRSCTTQAALTLSEIASVIKQAKAHDQFRSLFVGDESQEATVMSFLQKAVKIFGGPSTNDGWGPNLCGRLLYKDILHSKFCKSVEYHMVYQSNEKVLY